MREELAALTGGETREAILASLHGDINPERRELLESLGYIAGTDNPALPGHEYPNRRTSCPAGAYQDRGALSTGLALATRARPEAIAIFDTVLAAEPNRADVYYNRAGPAGSWGRGGFRATSPPPSASTSAMFRPQHAGAIDAKDGTGPARSSAGRNPSRSRPATWMRPVSRVVPEAGLLPGSPPPDPGLQTARDPGCPLQPRSRHGQTGPNPEAESTSKRSSNSPRPTREFRRAPVARLARNPRARATGTGRRALSAERIVTANPEELAGTETLEGHGARRSSGSSRRRPGGFLPV
jgi:hypothetical protein